MFIKFIKNLYKLVDLLQVQVNKMLIIKNMIKFRINKIMRFNMF